MLKLENATEHFWKLRDPAPDIAGPHAALPQLLVLPEDLTTAAERTQWKRMMSELPLLPKDEVGGKIVRLKVTPEGWAEGCRVAGRKRPHFCCWFTLDYSVVLSEKADMERFFPAYFAG